MDLQKRIGKWEKTHRIASFIFLFLLTVFISRLIVAISDPNIFIKNFEIHHFYAGVILLIIASLLMLYKKIKFGLALPLSAISIGLIIDEILFVSGKIRGPVTYESTLLPTIIPVILVLLLIELIFYLSSKK
ncbi:MAG: hypothetical protein BV456_05425 [Thermoplasmata archaeon M8B2D]|nr:MAG: hypothetical protein BV456_05425 [Thermoplasmata archaeon M8B2D]